MGQLTTGRISLRRTGTYAGAPVAGFVTALHIEDSLWIGPGQLAKTNAEQVSKVRQIIEGLGLEIATPDDARQILNLKGADQVSF